MLKEKLFNSRGFTLVEIAIVLVIIGLLIGGILKGREMIKNAKAKRVVKMADELRSAWNAFYDKYGVYPGDENKREIPPGDRHNGNGNGYITGNEIYYLFEDLQKAGFISGDYNGTSDLPTHPFGGKVVILYQNLNRTGNKHWIRFENMPWDVCQQIDMKYDDGKYNAGSIMANTRYSSSVGMIRYFYIEL
ncbi:MAG: prepilin-type cleavage/methylation domain-containing protein [Deltaproteobacteria bacterium]|nr:MAG: prepilin-type cleavage/methylation domain-containing protein [Deltaproteobacteria bacterium]